MSQKPTLFPEKHRWMLIDLFRRLRFRNRYCHR